MKKLAVVALLLAGCASEPPAQAPVTVAPLDTRSCAVILKDLEHVTADMQAKEAPAKKAYDNNKEIRDSYASKIFIWQYLQYDTATVREYEALKRRKEELDLIVADRGCKA